MANGPLKAPAAKDLIQELSLSRYISDEAESKQVVERCRDVFIAQIEKTSDRPEQIHRALEFIRTIWRKYDCEQIADIYDKFVKIEEALFGLEREEETGKRYRDHFVHMFNCFVFGLRVISAVLDQSKPETAQSVFKVSDENLKALGLPFGSDYRYDQRLFYLWTLVSTFHDIAIPFQHLTRLGKGISRFVEEFGWVFTDPRVEMHNFDASQLYHYFEVIGTLYGGRLELSEDRQKYARPQRPQHYLVKLLGREFDRRNHGVMSGFFLWKTIEEIFLVGRSHKYPLEMGQFDTYTEYVLNEDIARAALAISLHAIERDEKGGTYPRVFPIEFASYPLAFILVLSDELQEYLRWEGATLQKELKFNCHPIIRADFSEETRNITMDVTFSFDGKDRQTIIDRARAIARFQGLDKPIDEIKGAVELLGDTIKGTLERKLALGKDFRLTLSVCEDWSTKCYSKELSSAG